MNTFGHLFRVTTFGESHGAAIGGVVDGCPAGISLDLDFIQSELDRRRPGQSRLTTARKEADRVELLSGTMDGITTGTPIGFIVRNENQHSGDYDDLRDVFRPSHADYTYYIKYGLRDHRGGGRSSARETIAVFETFVCASSALMLKHGRNRLAISPASATGQNLISVSLNPTQCVVLIQSLRSRWKNSSFR